MEGRGHGICCILGNIVCRAHCFRFVFIPLPGGRLLIILTENVFFPIFVVVGIEECRVFLPLLSQQFQQNR